MTDQALFEELVKKKVLDKSLAEKTLRDASFTGRSAEEILYEKRLVDEIAAAIEDKSYKPMDLGISAAVSNRISQRMTRANKVIANLEGGDQHHKQEYVV